MSKAAKVNALIIVILAVIVSASIYWVKHHHPAASAATPPVLVELGKPQEILIPNSISSTGNLEAIQKTNLSAPLATCVPSL